MNIGPLNIILLFIIAFVIVAFMALVFFVFKNLFLLYMESRNRVLGYKFRTKVVALFVGIVLLPSVLLFVVASGLITTYIDRYLTPNIKEPIELSFNLGRHLYERELDRTLKEAERAEKGYPVAEGFTVRRLNALPENASETLKEAFEGKKGAEVITTPDGDIIRAFVPIKRGSRVVGVIEVEQVLPEEITLKAEKIKRAYQNYILLYQVKLPLKINYIIALAFFTLLVVFTALWVAIKISRWITEPVQRLAHATEVVAKGDLNIRVDLKREDEFGLLVNSFNRMVEELRESKKSLEEAYLESERRRVCLENVLEGINSGVISFDRQGRIITINSAALRILKLEERDVIHNTYEALLRNVQSEELKEFIKGIKIDEVGLIQREFNVRIADAPVILRVFITQLKDKNNQSLGLLVVFDDITELLKAKEALLWQEVTRQMAHEIKNPLTPIKLSTERLLRKWRKQDGDFGDALVSAAETIIREVEGLQRLVNDFSRFGRIPEIKKEPTDIREIVNEVVSLYSHLKRPISVEMDDTLPLVDLDREQFKRAIINLIDNAIAATKGEGDISIRIQMGESPGVLIVEVADTGIGIDEKTKKKLFVPYFSTKKEGSGLGLAIVHRIVTGHGGTITVMDNKPKGTRFIINIPTGG